MLPEETSVEGMLSTYDAVALIRVPAFALTSDVDAHLRSTWIVSDLFATPTLM